MAPPIIALNFHGIGEPHAGVPADEKPYWMSLDQFSGVIERVCERVNPHEVAFTFDDGNASDLIAAELLAARGLSGRFFLLAGRFDDPNYCSHNDARTLVSQGMIVGLHGRHHRNWRTLDDRELADETVAARSELAEVIGRAVDEVAIPFGSYNRRVMKWLAHEGFSRIHTSDRGMLHHSSRIWNRNTLRSDMPEHQLSVILQGAWPMHERLHRAATTYVKRNLV